MKWFEQLLENNTAADWLAALLAAVGVVIFLLIFKGVLLRYLRIYARKTDIKLDDLLASTLCRPDPCCCPRLRSTSGACG